MDLIGFIFALIGLALISLFIMFKLSSNRNRSSRPNYQEVVDIVVVDNPESRPRVSNRNSMDVDDIIFIEYQDPPTGYVLQEEIEIVDDYYYEIPRAARPYDDEFIIDHYQDF